VRAGALDRVTIARTPLERCAGDPEAFLQEAWGRRAIVRDGPGPGAFDDLLSLDDVDRVITTTALRTPFFRLVKAGERIDESAYTRSGRTGSRDVAGMADPARVAALFEDGATIVLQGLHRWSEPVTRFCRDLELELGHPCQVNAYVTPPGAQGLALHDDPHDVFVLQAFGQKHWEIHAAPGERARDPITARVESGDAIYMPAGTPHAASAQEVVSGHLTVGVHVTSWRDVLAGVWSELVDGHVAAEGPIPARWTDRPQDFARELEARLGSISDALGNVDALEATERRSQRFFSSRAQLGRGTIAERSAPTAFDDRTVLRRRPGTVFVARHRGDTLVILLGDRRLEMPAWLEPAMQRIAASSAFAVGDLASELPDADSRSVLVRRLIREGLLTARDGH
jgi:cupin superfamily protein